MLTEINGETDGDAIWLMRRLGDGLLLNTLLHEALHDSVFVERATRSGLRRTLSESDEHAIMAKSTTDRRGNSWGETHEIAESSDYRVLASFAIAFPAVSVRRRSESGRYAKSLRDDWSI